jgi:hypothetical protein
MIERSSNYEAGWLKLPPPMGEPDSDEDVNAVKPAPLVALYERLFASFREAEFTLFELGINDGDSLVMWRDAFPNATIVGLDIEVPQVELGDRVHMWKGDQTDCALLAEIRHKHAPGGFDIVIDDASHLGAETAASLRCLFNAHLRSGGLYVIEDWFTGYTDWWADGRIMDEAGFEVEGAGRVRRSLGGGTRFPSHDFGIPGVIKQVIDQMAAPLLPWFAGGGKGLELQIASLTIEGGAVVLVKSDPQPQVEDKG